MLSKSNSAQRVRSSFLAGRRASSPDAVREGAERLLDRLLDHVLDHRGEGFCEFGVAWDAEVRSIQPQATVPTILLVLRSDRKLGARTG